MGLIPLEDWLAYMPDATWKERGRKVAQAVGGQRVGCTGQATPDVVSPRLVIEVKHRKTLPDWLWLKQAVLQAQMQATDGRIGVVVLHEAGQSECLVVMSLRDFVRGWL